MLGNKALANTHFNLYSYIRNIEAGMIATTLTKNEPKELNNEHSKFSFTRMAKNKRKFNIVLAMTSLKLALLVWLEYIRLVDHFKSIKSKMTLDEFIAKQRKMESEYYDEQTKSNLEKKKKERLIKKSKQHYSSMNELLKNLCKLIAPNIS